MLPIGVASCPWDHVYWPVDRFGGAAAGAGAHRVRRARDHRLRAAEPPGAVRAVDPHIAVGPETRDPGEKAGPVGSAAHVGVCPRRDPGELLHVIRGAGSLRRRDFSWLCGLLAQRRERLGAKEHEKRNNRRKCRAPRSVNGHDVPFAQPMFRRNECGSRLCMRVRACSGCTSDGRLRVQNTGFNAKRAYGWGLWLFSAECRRTGRSRASGRRNGAERSPPAARRACPNPGLSSPGAAGHEHSPKLQQDQ